MPPHGHESSSYQNGYSQGNEFGNILPSGGDNDNFGTWAYDAASHIPNQNAQSDPYSSWPANTGLDYNPQVFTKSPSNLQTNSFAGFGNPHQYTHPSTYDPTLVSGATNGTYGLGSSPYGQSQQMQNGTIAPQALEHERAHSARPQQTLDPSYARTATTDPPSYTRVIPAAPTADQAALHNAIPAGTRTGPFLTKDIDVLSEATNSTQVNPFLSISNIEFELPINRG